DERQAVEGARRGGEPLRERVARARARQADDLQALRGENDGLVLEQAHAGLGQPEAGRLAIAVDHQDAEGRRVREAGEELRQRRALLRRRFAALEAEDQQIAGDEQEILALLVERREHALLVLADVVGLQVRQHGYA